MTLVLSGQFPGVPTCLAVLARRAYRIAPPVRAIPLADDVPFPNEPVYAASSNEGAGRRLVEDAPAAAIGKPLTDVIVRGTARSLRGPFPVVETGVRVGAARKAVRAIGDRKIVVGAGGRLSFS